MTKVERFDCAEAREAVHTTLDTELVEAGLKQCLELHLSGCSACREFAEELRAIQGGLQSLPELELPDEVLQRVWNRTTRARPVRFWARPRNFAAAAAAVVVLALGGLWIQREAVPAGPTEAELRQAAVEARMVLQLTSRALRKTEAAAFREVLTDEVSEALRRAPIRWPERSAAERRGS